MARVTGFVQAIKYNDGDFVKKGTLLFVIEQKPYELQVEQAKATEESARATLKKDQLDYDRTAELLKSGSTTQAKLDDLTGSRDRAKAALDQAVASRKLAENDLFATRPLRAVRWHRLRAPGFGRRLCRHDEHGAGDHRAERPDLRELQYQRTGCAAHPR